jgi:hypothetical protein
MQLRSLCLLLVGVLIGLTTPQLFRSERLAAGNSTYEPRHHSKHRPQVGLASSLTSIKHKEGAQGLKELPISKVLIAETNTDSDNFLKIDEIIRSGAFQSHLQDFETFCSSSRRENVVAYLLACVDGGDESVLMRMNAAALRNPSESIRDQALISLISLTGIDFTDHEAAIKWAAVNLPQGKSLYSGK